MTTFAAREYESVRRTDVGMLVLRIAVGIVFIAHGAQKLFTFGIAGVTAGFAQMGIPAPELVAPLVTYVELIGGVALLLGFATRFAAVTLAVNMAGAIMFAHLRNGFFLPTGIEYAATLLAACATVALIGAGFYSVDGAISLKRGLDSALHTDVVVDAGAPVPR